MYSVVLLMAITTGGEAPDCHRSECGCSGGGLLSHRHGHSCSGSYAGTCGCYTPPVACGCSPAPVTYGCTGSYMMPPPVIKKEEIKKLPGDKPKEEIKKPGETNLGAPARLIVSMPADARFTIDNYTSPAKSATQIVESGPLGADDSRTYVLKAEVVRDGKVQTVEEHVTVRSGEEKNVTLSLPAVVAAR